MTGKLPTRLLDVGSNEGDLCLCLSSNLDQDIKYFTLSHCWGSKPFLTLTKSNIKPFYSKIPFYLLSKTFRDAITATRRLGFRYLWIDSLCIIQGDHEDWSKEAATMGTVYANSTLNLAAIDSPDGDTGLFFERSEKKILGWRLKLPLDQQQGGSRWESVWDCVPVRRRETFDNNFLSSRAWVFQERFLAPRNLRFGKAELSWECRKRIIYEASPFDDQSLARDRTLPADNALVNITNDAAQWFQIVRHYSKGKLTVASDKLTALSGVAKLFALKSGKTYIAGLWKEDLLNQLLWETSDPTNKIDICRAPSWSWAAIDSQVCLLPHGHTIKPILPVVTVEQVFVEPSQSVFEDARGAYILLRTRGLKSCRIGKWKGKPEDWGAGQFGKYVVELSWVPPAQLYSKVSLDYKDLDLDQDFYLLRLFDGMGLVVKPTDEGTFIRTGCFRHLMVSQAAVASGTEEAFDVNRRFAKQMTELTEAERGVLGESVGLLDEDGTPLYIIKLI